MGVDQQLGFSKSLPVYQVIVTGSGLPIALIVSITDLTEPRRPLAALDTELLLVLAAEDFALVFVFVFVFVF